MRGKHEGTNAGDNLFPRAGTGSSVWSDNLKSFQQRIGKYFARSEAKGAAFDYILCYVQWNERKNGWQMAEQVGCQSIPLAALVGRAIWDEEQMCRGERLCSRASG